VLVSSLSKKKAREIATVIVQAIHQVDRGSVRRWDDRQHIDFTCYWCSSQGWVPWHVSDLDAVALVARTIAQDRRVFGVQQLPVTGQPETWNTGWVTIREIAYALIAEPSKKPSTSTALKPVPTERLKRWLDAARRDGGPYGEFRPAGWGRSFTVANLTAELSTRPDRHTVPDTKQRKVIRQKRARHGARHGAGQGARA